MHRLDDGEDLACRVYFLHSVAPCSPVHSDACMCEGLPARWRGALCVCVCVFARSGAIEDRDGEREGDGEMER